jgi:hypothetical protein
MQRELLRYKSEFNNSNSATASVALIALGPKRIKTMPRISKLYTLPCNRRSQTAGPYGMNSQVSLSGVSLFCPPKTITRPNAGK